MVTYRICGTTGGTLGAAGHRDQAQAGGWAERVVAYGICGTAGGTLGAAGAGRRAEEVVAYGICGGGRAGVRTGPGCAGGHHKVWWVPQRRPGVAPQAARLPTARSCLPPSRLPAPPTWL